MAMKKLPIPVIYIRSLIVQNMHGYLSIYLPVLKFENRSEFDILYVSENT